ncbi:MAG: hypothetical protein HUJ63_09520 [Enterococcus sp.]|nr:hypothetical protein [Enterococcus sp.]
MKKSVNGFVKIMLCVALSFVLGGCGLVPSVELTEEEQKVISEYAAGLLLKYDKNYSGSIGFSWGPCQSELVGT